jgi:3-dehydroquinate synthase
VSGIVSVPHRGRVPRRGPRAFLEKFDGDGLEEIRRNDDTYLASPEKLVAWLGGGSPPPGRIARKILMIVDVNLGSRSYRIVVASGALQSVGQRLRELRLGSRAALVSDGAIMRLYGKTVVTSLEAEGFTVTTIEVPEGEAAKTLAVAEHCWDRLLTAGLDRTSTVMALGGGAVGDVAGFAAATYMRGINFVQLPTTVLAQVDASIGGKTAIDHPLGKNMIGAFHQPRLVVVDPAVARTPPEREFRSGLAEIVKHGIVLDADYFAELERDLTSLAARDLGVLERIIGGSCRLKASVVERDEREAELRHVLNYGHTIGHALEAATGYARYAHGEAVSLGIVAEARLARRLGIADDETTARQERMLETLGLPVRAPSIDVEPILSAVARDKKAKDGRVPFVLAPRIGAFRIVYDIPTAEIRAVVASLAS